MTQTSTNRLEQIIKDIDKVRREHDIFDENSEFTHKEIAQTLEGEIYDIKLTILSILKLEKELKEIE